MKGPRGVSRLGRDKIISINNCSSLYNYLGKYILFYGILKLTLVDMKH
jgi:hypothetical protein